MRVKFREIRMSKKNKVRLEQINSIIGEYKELTAPPEDRS